MKPSRLGGLFVLAVVAHVESVSYWFVSTDTFALIRSARVQSGHDLVTTFTEPMMHGTGFTDIALFYRPLSSLTFALDYWLWGLAPAGYHATNLVLHGLAVVLAAVAVAEVTGRPAIGGVTGVLFALHPLTAEVVPVVARRQDVVMFVFVLGSLALFIRSWRTQSTRLYVTSLGAYGLALAAKEPALLLPVLVGTWVVTEHGVSDPRAALLDGVRAVLPFALLTAGYLAVRVTVLGGLGGYLERPSLTVSVLPDLVVKYVLSMWYPADTIGVGAAGDGAWLLVPVGLAVLVGVILGWSLPACARIGVSARLVALVGILVAVAAIPVLLVLDGATLAPTLAAIGYGGSPNELPFPYPYPGPTSPLIGLTLIAAVMAGVLWSALGSRRALADHRGALVFFTVWLFLPVFMFYRSGDYAIRSGYPSLVPAMALLAILIVAGFRRTDTGFAVDPVLASAVLLLVVPMVAATPLVHPYDGWAASGEVNRLTLTGVEAELEEAPGDDPVRVVGVPNGIMEQRRSFPRVASIGYLGHASFQAWLDLRGYGDARRIWVAETRVLHRAPVAATFDTVREDDRMTVRVQYVTTEEGLSKTATSRSDAWDPEADPWGQRFASPELPRTSTRSARPRSRWMPNTAAPRTAPYQSVPRRMTSVALTASGRV